MSNSPEHDAMYQPAVTFAKANYDTELHIPEPTRQRLNSGGEVPDLLAFRHVGASLVVDFKRSVSDCHAHLRKPHVEEPWKGMGVYRVILTYTEITKPPMPDGWGLWALDAEGTVYERIEPEPFKHRNRDGEIELLVQHFARQMPGESGHAAKKTTGNNGQIPPKVWSEIYSSVHDDEWLYIDDAAAIVTNRSPMSKPKAKQALRLEAKAEGMALVRYGQMEFLELAEKTESESV